MPLPVFPLPESDGDSFGGDGDDPPPLGLLLLPSHIGLPPPSEHMLPPPPPGVSVVKKNESPPHPIPLHVDEDGGWDVLHLAPLTPLLNVSTCPVFTLSSVVCSANRMMVSLAELSVDSLLPLYTAYSLRLAVLVVKNSYSLYPVHLLPSLVLLLPAQACCSPM